MQPLRGLHGAALRARPARGRAVSRCCPRAPRGCVAARDARSACPAARSAAAGTSRPARRRGGLSGAPRVARRAQRGGCGAGAPLARPRLARLRRGVSRCASRGARQPPGDTTATQAPARPSGGVRPPPSASARSARPCRGLPPWCGAAAAGFPQPRPGSGRRAPGRAPSSPGFARAPCLFGAAARPAAPGLPCGFRRPKKAAADSRSRISPHPPPAPQGAGAQGGPPALHFSFGRDIISARGTSPKLAFKLDHPQHVAAVSLSLTKYSVLYNDRVRCALRARSHY